ncbi:hypothetical protein TIN4_73 [Tsukamurella phage TIN4]|uniref:Uncharacterized protein n=2 Tax=Tinduovirus TIN3 TaxID=1982571 RepID=A0A0K0N634_9CAUD|nr:hypothetical protein AVT54_gp052 [Tsukamurella phage TIN3]YP_009604203.1 hypothetical protein FDH87_gp052 [Tsukamurella phage TIN4]AKJ71870.1 hypothetical protein TIN3_73 [Tsukamurella phage TIN3]AKJ71979.1 hypothetical protein TIN4_73 [Tsukamurella phage TIN4]
MNNTKRFAVGLMIAFSASGFGLGAAFADPNNTNANDGDLGTGPSATKIESGNGPRDVGEKIKPVGVRQVGEPIDSGSGPRPDPEDLIPSDDDKK